MARSAYNNRPIGVYRRRWGNEVLRNRRRVPVAVDVAPSVTTRIPLVLVNGLAEQLRAADGFSVDAAEIGIFGATPVVQPAAANQVAITNSSGGTGGGTLVAVGDTSAGDESTAINNNFTVLHELLDEVRTAQVNLGIMKGSA